MQCIVHLSYLFGFYNNSNYGNKAINFNSNLKIDIEIDKFQGKREWKLHTNF